NPVIETRHLSPANNCKGSDTSMKHAGSCYTRLIFFIGAVSGLAQQSPDVNQMKNKLQQLEQMMQELKQQIANVEQAQNVPAQPLATANKIPEANVPPPLVPTEHIGDLTRNREVASLNPDSAARIDNEPMDRALRGYFRLPATGTLIKLGGFVKTDVYVD